MTNPPDDPASGRTPVIGLTGPIGCGKTTVAGWLADRGAVVVDADVVAREMTAPGQPAHDAILSLFGEASGRPMPRSIGPRSPGSSSATPSTSPSSRRSSIRSSGRGSSSWSPRRRGPARRPS